MQSLDVCFSKVENVTAF